MPKGPAKLYVQTLVCRYGSVCPCSVCRHGSILLCLVCRYRVEVGLPVGGRGEH